MTERLTKKPDESLLSPVDKEFILSCLLAYCEAHKDNQQDPVSYFCDEMDIDWQLCLTPLRRAFRRSDTPSIDPVRKLFEIVEKRNQLPWLEDLFDQKPDAGLPRIRRLINHCSFNPTDPDQLGDFISRDGHERYFHSIAKRYPAPMNPENLNPKKNLRAIAQQPPFRGSLIYCSLRFGWDWEDLKILSLPSDANIETLKQAWKEEKWELVGKAIYWAYLYQDYKHFVDTYSKKEMARDEFQSALYQIANCD